MAIPVVVVGHAGNVQPRGHVATTMRIVNAIRALCDAASGLSSSLDLPLTLPQHAFEARSTA